MSLSQDSGTRQNDYYVDYSGRSPGSYWPRIRGQKTSIATEYVSVVRVRICQMKSASEVELSVIGDVIQYTS